MNSWALHTPAETEAFGAAVADCLPPGRGCVVYLEGELGAGKTTLVRGLLRALGVTGAIRSPTYTLLEPYQAQGRPLVHLDLYRLAAPRELHSLGLADYPPEQVRWLVEWPQRGQGLLPPPDLRLVLEHAGAERRVSATGVAGIGAAFSGRLSHSPKV